MSTTTMGIKMVGLAYRQLLFSFPRAMVLGVLLPFIPTIALTPMRSGFRCFLSYVALLPGLLH
jgi:hypothetical protein